MSLENRETRPKNKEKFLKETPTTASFGGIEIERAKTPEDPTEKALVPRKNPDFLGHRLSQEALQTYAVAVHMGLPLVYVEGASKLGKSFTAREFAARIGAKLYPEDCNKGMRGKDFFAATVVEENVFRTEDSITSAGLKQTKGERSIVLWDEANSVRPDEMHATHGLLDAIKNGDTYVPKRGGVIEINPELPKPLIIALGNPLGEKYQREEQDLAWMRRAVKIRFPTSYPEDVAKYMDAAEDGDASDEQEAPNLVILTPRETPLTAQERVQIPGYRQIRDKFAEFHNQATQLLIDKKIAGDQEQGFDYEGDRDRVKEFVRYFHKDGDNIDKTYRTGIEVFYVRALENQKEKEDLRRLARRVVRYVPESVRPKRIEIPDPQVTEKSKGTVKEEDIFDPASFENPDLRERKKINPLKQAIEELTSLEGKELQEKDAWTEALGSPVETKPLPEYLTSEVQQKLKAHGFSLVYIPELNLNDRVLERSSPDSYIDFLQTEYPLLDRDKEYSYWSSVKDGNIAFPRTSGSGKWLAVREDLAEVRTQPQRAKKTGLFGRLGANTLVEPPVRRQLQKYPRNDWETSLSNTNYQEGLLESIGLEDLREQAQFTMLDAFTLRLLGYRGFTRPSKTKEWTSTDYFNTDTLTPTGNPQQRTDAVVLTPDGKIDVANPAINVNSLGIKSDIGIRHVIEFD
jgi:MoxR-like ATPase